MKKHIFPILAAMLLLCVLSACDLLSFPEPQVEKKETPEEKKPPRVLPKNITLRLSDAGEYVDDTIGIVGGVGLGNVVSTAAGTNELANSPKVNSCRDSRSESRALTDDIAQASHDFFEAVFYYSGPTNRTIARAVWNVGETPELRGVYRTDTGIDYGNINVSTNANNTGYAMLFAGVKEDKTLLAIGKLVQVDGQNGTTIYTDTRSVTFEVAALRAGTRFMTDRANSSFFTSYGAGNGSNDPANVSETNTTIYDNIFIHYEGKKLFPFFRLNRPPSPADNPGTNATTRGTYTFNTTSGTTFTNYAAGIVLAGGFNYEVRNPRYIITNGLYQYSSIFVQDLRHGLAVMNNNIQPPDYIDEDTFSNLVYFTNPVQFTFVTTNSPDGSIFALVFEIFVNNLTPRPTSAASVLSPDNADPVKWRISPGTGTKWLDLDDGLGGEGGAILLGSGNVAAWLAPYNALP